MYRKNRRAQQPLLLSDINDLPERSLKLLEGSWAPTFRKEIFLKINEERFGVLYSDKASRPNTPVNILVGLEILKNERSWTDEEMYGHFTFDLQVRYAVGCDKFGEDEFELRTMYNFRRRLMEYTLESGQDLLKELFEEITDEQIAKLGLKTEKQRFDSTQIMSNIADLSRLELAIEVIQRIWRNMSETERARYAGLCGPYIKESAGQYAYRLKGREVYRRHLEQVGQVLKQLLEELAEGYGQEPFYAMAKRLFEENYVVEASGMRAKENSEISAGSIQSLDDLEATYRRKGFGEYKGYVVNLAETCDPDNPIQLIDQVQVMPNQVSDIQLLKDGFEALQKRTGMDTVVTDGGYVGPEIDQLMREHGAEQIATALTGAMPEHKDGKLAFSDFEMEQDSQGEVIQVTCPTGQPAQIQTSTTGKSYRLIFDPATCKECPIFKEGHCLVEFNKKQTQVSLYVPRDRANSAQRRRHFEKHKQGARNLRTAVEATVFQFKHQWAKGKLRVRGLFRISTAAICSALSVNMRRIDRYRKGKMRDRRSLEARKSLRTAAIPA